VYESIQGEEFLLGLDSGWSLPLNFYIFLQPGGRRTGSGAADSGAASCSLASGDRDPSVNDSLFDFGESSRLLQLFRSGYACYNGRFTGS
jgi:hypothetical protein